MIDHAARVLFNKAFDAHGAIAASGQVNKELLGKLLQHPFLHRQPPRSAWRLDFGSSYANEILAAHQNIKPEDLLATFTEFTAATISKSIADHIPRLEEISLLISLSVFSYSIRVSPFTFQLAVKRVLEVKPYQCAKIEIASH
jgi:anhydro-N-acetylmuramic acid kinase